MKFQEFRGLSAEAKNMEILKMLPRLNPLTKEFEKLKNSLNVAIDKVFICRIVNVLSSLLSDKLPGVRVWNTLQQDPECG